MRRRFLSAVLLVAAAHAARADGDPNAGSFEKDVLPILQAKCLECHGASKPKAGLDLRTKTAMLKGGDSGPVLTPGSADKSLLWNKVYYNRMPPGKARKLTAAQKKLIRDWIVAGAK